MLTVLLAARQLIVPNVVSLKWSVTLRALNHFNVVLILDITVKNFWDRVFCIAVFTLCSQEIRTFKTVSWFLFTCFGGQWPPLTKHKAAAIMYLYACFVSEGSTDKLPSLCTMLLRGIDSIKDGGSKQDNFWVTTLTNQVILCSRSMPVW